MPENTNLNFKMRVADWQGYVRKSLEDIEKRLEKADENIKGEFKEIKKEFGKVNSRINHLYFKVGTIGGTTGLVVSLVMWLIVKYK